MFKFRLSFFFTYFVPHFYGSPPSAPSNTTSNVTTKATSDPWSGAAQYLTSGGTSGKGVYGDVNAYANQYSALTPQESSLMSGQTANLTARNPILQSNYATTRGLSNNIINGRYNTNFGAVAPQSVAQDMAAMGANDPSQALSNAMSGRVNTDVLGAMNQKNINQSMRGYNDAILNAQQNIMPGINNDAFASGQYGGSRQGVAQGMALQGMDRSARDLGIAAMDSGNQLYGNAYQQAQNTAAQTASNQAQLGVNNGQFNANLGLQNQTQSMAQQAQNLSNVTSGNSLANDATTNLFSGQDQTYNGQQALANTPQQQQLDMLNLRLNSLTPGAALGGATTGSTSTPYYSSTLGNISGAALGAGGLLSNLSGKK